MRSVVIVGRPNVGKSALFNRLAGRMISIVHDQAGVTRDRISAVCRSGSAPFEIVDTGGIGASPDPEFAGATREAAEIAMNGADLLLFVVDGKDGVTPLDRELAGEIRRLSRPCVLVVNKIDTEHHEDRVDDFASLGFAENLGVSAAHGRNFPELVQKIESLVPLQEDDIEVIKDAARISIVGRPNVGKSSLVNAILGDKRTIVSDVAGTTRDAVDIAYQFRGKDYILCDTAGIRHRSKHNTSVEVFSVMRSEKSIGRADLCVLVIDAAQGVTAQDKKIGGLIQEAGKAALIVLNKWDLVIDGAPSKEFLKDRLDTIRRDLFFLTYAPVVMLSAQTGENLNRLFLSVEKVRQHATRRIGTGELNRILKEASERTPPPAKDNRRFKILYATQVIKPPVRPFDPPMLLAFVNHPKLLTDAYKNFLINAVRKHYEFPGLPVQLRLKGRIKETLEERLYRTRTIDPARTRKAKAR